MNIGYACQCLQPALPTFRTCTMKYATEENLKSIIEHNLMVLEKILEENHQHHVHLFRISSDLIPFGSSPINTLDWKTMYQETLSNLGEKAKHYQIRLTMHPGQYTVLNSPDINVVQRSIQDLRYHCDVLNSMKLDMTSKLVLHIGGIYGDKQGAMDRFIQVFQTLDTDIKQRLIIENDDRYYTLEDVITLSNQLHIPVVFDNLHHHILPSYPTLTLYDTLQLVKQTWKPMDGKMKLHYSQQDEQKRTGAHATYLQGSQFLSFCHDIHWMDVDIMIELKSKNLAAYQALDYIEPKYFQPQIVWKQYRYVVLRHSIPIFSMLEQDPTHYSIEHFYDAIYQALSQPLYSEEAILCYRFIYQEWMQYLTTPQKEQLLKAMQRFEEGKLKEQGLKNCFSRMAIYVQEESNYLFL